MGFILWVCMEWMKAGHSNLLVVKRDKASRVARLFRRFYESNIKKKNVECESIEWIAHQPSTSCEEVSLAPYTLMLCLTSIFQIYHRHVVAASSVAVNGENYVTSTFRRSLSAVPGRQVT